MITENKLTNAYEKEQKEKLKKIIAESQKKWDKIKGANYRIPDYEPETFIFIRDKDNPMEKIAEFKKKHSMAKDVLAKKALESRKEVIINIC